MSQQAKPISMKELCEVFQKRKRRIFGERTSAEQQEPPKVASRSFEKDRENPSAPFKNSNTLLNHLPPVHKQQTRRSRSQSNIARVASPQRIKHTVVIRHRTSHRQVSQFSNIQGQQRTPQQAKMVTTKPSAARQNDAEENTESSEERTTFKGDTKIHRPCLAHTSLAVPKTRTTMPQSETNVGHFQPETVLARHEPSESEQSTEKHQGATKQEQKAGAHPSSGRHSASKQNPRENKQSIENHQSATKRQHKQRARDDGREPSAGRRIAGMNQVLQQRRQETSELVQSSGRRMGRCSKTDCTQQHRTFVRVLRKRF